jgi:hypothetical protein
MSTGSRILLIGGASIGLAAVLGAIAGVFGLPVHSLDPSATPQQMSRAVRRLLDSCPDCGPDLLAEVRHDRFSREARAAVVETLFVFQAGHRTDGGSAAGDMWAIPDEQARALQRRVTADADSPSKRVALLHDIAEHAGLSLAMTGDAQLAFAETATSPLTIRDIPGWEAVHWLCRLSDCGWDVYGGMLYVEVFAPLGAVNPVPLTGRERLEATLGVKMSTPPEEAKSFDGGIP